MLEIIVPASEVYDSENNLFYNIDKNTTLHLEHSLVSISKWEAKWKKPFFDTKNKGNEEILDYIRMMTINKDVDPNVYYCLTGDNIREIEKYIEDPMTATTFHNIPHSGGKKEIITSELIYYFMIAYNIPVEFQKWHINRLLTLIRVCDIKNSPAKKMSKSEILSRNRALNAARRAASGSKG